MAHRKKFEIDAAGQAPGRLATKIATFLMGKHKPTYRPHVDNGDKVVILNVSKMIFTGKKLEQKVYYKHSMHPGGLKETPAKKMMKEKPEEVLIHAVMRMLPKNKLRTQRILRISFK
ncbi:MAG: 50S ribosomal protein L13 [Candidatus Magasanikbacteria bacterium CG10_big_fil_rev_8_21_14_0_10_36_32]|uniref:Large ribosomal subunit protein uL13 n=1 Tax=Candidatus Magasanikbacteria bacterium CG10_big_fil_rev_8_21_14_0_10_36_32 TaxID=1974646 RepID=A0A2M6W7K6_9BACT|nr:MAG: 50S ribosomal protein L13 [Candidatus Magasanikbacteria bacterium CG10_big_fil_rev_8_21_14_0_10_36_32]